jgi:hypothetical protein
MVSGEVSALASQAEGDSLVASVQNAYREASKDLTRKRSSDNGCNGSSMSFILEFESPELQEQFAFAPSFISRAHVLAAIPRQTLVAAELQTSLNEDVIPKIARLFVQMFAVVQEPPISVVHDMRRCQALFITKQTGMLRRRDGEDC